jgi:hypothetical protein
MKNIMPYIIKQRSLNLSRYSICSLLHVEEKKIMDGWLCIACLLFDINTYFCFNNENFHKDKYLSVLYSLWNKHEMKIVYILPFITRLILMHHHFRCPCFIYKNIAGKWSVLFYKTEEKSSTFLFYFNMKKKIKDYMITLRINPWNLSINDMFLSRNILIIKINEILIVYYLLPIWWVGTSNWKINVFHNFPDVLFYFKLFYYLVCLIRIEVGSFLFDFYVMNIR